MVAFLSVQFVFSTLFLMIELYSDKCQCARITRDLSLNRLNVSPDNFTIAGFSSGAAQAIQFHFSHSSIVRGVGVFSGVPYLYGYGRVREDFYVNDPHNMNITTTINQIDSYATWGRIDPTEFLTRSPVYVYHGTRDSIVNPGSVKVIEQVYKNYGVNTYNNLLDADHGMPVDTDDIGGPCEMLNLIQNLVNRCKYNGAYEMYNYLYGGNLKKPTDKVPLKGDFFEFDQSQFFDKSDPRAASMDTVGFAYIPSGCKTLQRSANCRLSFVLHGCIQSRQSYGDKFPRTTGFMETAELNDIILVFPQAKPYMFNPKNRHGCFDWWGFTGEGYGTKEGLQIIALKRMLDRILVR